MAVRNEQREAKSPPPSFSIRSVSIYFIYLAAIIYSSGGFIPVPELQFAAFASFYLVVLAKLAFPPVTPTRPPSVFAGSKLLKVYVSVGALVGLVFPLVLLLVGLYRGDRRLFRQAVPHTALLVFQILSERVAWGSNSASLPIRAFVPIWYNARRLFSIWSWINIEFATPPPSSELETMLLQGFGKFVAAANLAFWSFNLFCFLLPVFLPLAMRGYYEQALTKEKL